MLGRATRFRSIDLRSLADEELMYRVHAGEMGAFEVVFDRHMAVAYSLAYRICQRPAMAEDAVQEAFLSLWRARDRYDPARGSVRAWVLSAVRNRSLDALRRERARAGKDVIDDASVGLVPAGDRTELEAERNEQGQRISDALDSLPSEQRQVIELAYFGGLTHSEIARRLSLPAGTVKGRMRLGLTRMRALLAEPWEVVA